MAWRAAARQAIPSLAIREGLLLGPFLRHFLHIRLLLLIRQKRGLHDFLRGLLGSEGDLRNRLAYFREFLHGEFGLYLLFRLFRFPETAPGAVRDRLQRLRTKD